MSYTLSVMEAARSIGVSRPTIYRLIGRGELPTFKLGSRTLILRTDLENLLVNLVQRAA